MRERIGDYEAMAETLDRLGKEGLLLMTGSEGNPMTIGWGTIGRIWGRPVFLVLVRPSRHSFGLLEELPEFSVNVPTDELKDTVELCGTESGRDMDKAKECGLTLNSCGSIGVPYVEDCPIHYECRVIHKGNVINADLIPQIVAECYPTGDFHRVFYGEILGVFRKQ